MTEGDVATGCVAVGTLVGGAAATGCVAAGRDAGAGAAGEVTCTRRCPGVAELAGATLVGLNNPPLVATVVTLRSDREVRLESTAVRVPSTGPRVPVSDAELLPTSIGEAEASFGAVVEAIVPASAAFAQTPEANTLAAAIRPKN